MDNLSSLLDKLTYELRRTKMMIATAESCTGGMIASYLTDLPGSSQWFERGFVSYSNLAKQEMLNVEKTLIIQQGAVSEAVAKAMALGALQHSSAAISLAVTGIAGPDGGTPNKPVGTVWLAFATKDLVRSQLCQFGSLSRQEIRLLTCREAFLGALSLLAEVH